MIIGLTGKKSSEASKYLKSKGFHECSFSDLIASVEKGDIPKVGSQYRERFGHGYWALKAWEGMKKEVDYVVTDFSHPAEVDLLRKQGGFFLVEIRQGKNRGQVVGSPNVVLVDTGKGLKGKLDRMMADFKKIDPPTYVRPSWDEYFISLVDEIGKRGTCDRGRSGCLIVKNKRIMTTGYVGSPIGIEHCDQIGHEFKATLHEDGTKSMHCVRTTHAEQNAICQAARYGISIEGATLYCKMEPCYVCAKMIINAGIKRVVALKRYHASAESRRIFAEAGVKLDVVIDEYQTYSNMK